MMVPSQIRNTHGAVTGRYAGGRNDLACALAGYQPDPEPGALHRARFLPQRSTV